jgi:hypothetical protein
LVNKAGILGSSHFDIVNDPCELVGAASFLSFVCERLGPALRGAVKTFARLISQ